MLHSACVFVCVFVFLCVRSPESVRQQEIAKVVRVGSTPRGTEKEQREHLPPHQEQLFNPLRRGDAGMGGAMKGWRDGRQCYTRLLFSFTCSPLQSLQTLPQPCFIPSGFMETGAFFLCVCVHVFFTSPCLRQSCEDTSCLFTCRSIRYKRMC